MSPYGPSGAQNLLSSVSEFGTRYFEDVVGAADGQSIRWLAVVPLADAVHDKNSFRDHGPDCRGSGAGQLGGC